jgi:hypothetical protein
LRDSTISAGIGRFAAIQTVGPIGMELSVISVHDPPAIEAAIAAFARRPNGGLIATASPFGSNHPGVIAALARARERDRGLFGWIVLSLVISPLLGGIFLFVLPT